MHYKLRRIEKLLFRLSKPLLEEFLNNLKLKWRPNSNTFLLEKRAKTLM